MQMQSDPRIMRKKYSIHPQIRRVANHYLQLTVSAEAEGSRPKLSKRHIEPACLLETANSHIKDIYDVFPVDNNDPFLFFARVSKVAMMRRKSSRLF